jgi:N-acetylglucosamine-6-phosphate deacetylase
MKQLVISGGHLITPLDERFADVVIADGMISSIGGAETGEGESLDASGCYVTPGLIDLQVNGGPHCDFWGAPDVAHIRQFADDLAKAGVTTILPTLITADLAHIRKNIDFLSQEAGVGLAELSPVRAQLQPAAVAKTQAAKLKSGPTPVRLPALHLEGPCLSPKRPGVHPVEHLQPLSLAVLEQIVTDAVKLITVAPELDGAAAALKFLAQRNVVVALGHSNATFEQARQAFDAGIRLVTHIFNAMPPIHHRDGGAVTAALLDDRVSCCMICDGKHLSAEAVSLLVKAKTAARLILVTDSAQVGTSQGGLVGSSIVLADAVRNVVNWGCASVKDAFLMATYNPARAMNWQEKVGHLSEGKLADLVIWDKNTLAVKHVIAGGELLF